ncbi:MAG: hypothetical protein ACPGNT_08295 [Rhodospirillales bacterium]
MKPLNRILASVALAAQVIPGPALAAAWNPVASEKLIKLPAEKLEKAIERDARNSELGQAIVGADDNIRLKTQTLADLQGAIDRAEGDIRTDLQMQFLDEKKAYLDLMRDQQDLRKKRALTKVKLYERLLSKLNREEAAKTPGEARLQEQRQAALARFEASRQAIDTKLMQSSLTEQSRYSKAYAENLAAIESLQRAIDAHPMNEEPERLGLPITRAEYLRDLIARNQAEIAVIDQERNILGYMAKLVSLDALALSEDIVDAETGVWDETEGPEETSIAASVSLFAPN